MWWGLVYSADDAELILCFDRRGIGLIKKHWGGCGEGRWDLFGCPRPRVCFPLATSLPTLPAHLGGLGVHFGPKIVASCRSVVEE